MMRIERVIMFGMVLSSECIKCIIDKKQLCKDSHGTSESPGYPE